MTRLERIITAIQKTASELEIHPTEVTKAQLLKNDQVTNWDIKQFPGGLGSIKRAHFPVVGKDLIQIRENQEMSSYVTKLEKKLGEKQLTETAILKALEKNITPVNIKSYTPKKLKTKQPRDIIATLNDLHYGLIVDETEVGGTNKYGWKEACRRTAYFTQQVCNYKLDKRDDIETLHLILNGDIIAGIIHGLTSRDAELLTFQMNGALHILTHVVARLAENYKKIVVHGISGNHEDMRHRREGGRIISQKYDSYANIVYYALSATFRNVKNVSFDFPKTPYITINTLGGRMIAAHGDTVFSTALGNPGTKLNVKSLGDEIHRFNMGELAKGKEKVNLFIFGHTHSHAYFTTSDGVEVYVIPSLSGTDTYAQSLTINSNVVRQLIFESTKNFILGDSRLVKVDVGDNMPELDKIIPIYNKELKWQE